MDVWGVFGVGVWLAGLDAVSRAAVKRSDGVAVGEKKSGHEECIFCLVVGSGVSCSLSCDRPACAKRWNRCCACFAICRNLCMSSDVAGRPRRLRPVNTVT